MPPRLTICVPTDGKRPELRQRTLDSILSQMVLLDQLIVDMTPGKWGYPARERMGQMVSRNSQTDFALFMDDDDYYTDGAFEIIRDRIGEDRDSLHLFRGEWSGGPVIWREQEIREGNVSTQLVAVPRRLAGTSWGRRYEADHDFIAACAEMTSVMWHEDVICRVDPVGLTRTRA